MRVLLSMTAVTGVGAEPLQPNAGSTQEKSVYVQDDTVGGITHVSVKDVVIMVLHSVKPAALVQ